ncbi:MAG: hypothetical protein NVS2B9_04520 [Myxococcales bacterium]
MLHRIVGLSEVVVHHLKRIEREDIAMSQTLDQGLADLTARATAITDGVKAAALVLDGINDRIATAISAAQAAGATPAQLAELPHGGSGAVAIDGASSFSRLTAVLVNADVTQNGYSRSAGDWQYLKNAQPFAARLTTDFTPPRARRRAPAPGARNVRARAVSITFTKPVVGISSHTIVLVASNGHRVRARVRVRSGSRVATLTPLAELRRGTRYRVRPVSSITDKDLNPLPRTAWSFTTAR